MGLSSCSDYLVPRCEDYGELIVVIPFDVVDAGRSYNSPLSLLAVCALKLLSDNSMGADRHLGFRDIEDDIVLKQSLLLWRWEFPVERSPHPACTGDTSRSWGAPGPEA